VGDSGDHEIGRPAANALISVYDGVQRCGDLHVVPDFLHDLRRHG
jgi:hypothetical protein